MPLSLDEIKAELIRLRSHIEDSYEINHVLTFVMQSLQQASTGIEQYLRNIKIDAEMEAHRLEDLAKKRG